MQGPQSKPRLLGNVGLETLHTLHVDVKHAILASCTNVLKNFWETIEGCPKGCSFCAHDYVPPLVLDSRERSAIEVSMYIRMFQEFTWPGIDIHFSIIFLSWRKPSPLNTTWEARRQQIISSITCLLTKMIVHPVLSQ